MHLPNIVYVDQKKMTLDMLAQSIRQQAWAMEQVKPILQKADIHADVEYQLDPDKLELRIVTKIRFSSTDDLNYILRVIWGKTLDELKKA